MLDNESWVAAMAAEKLRVELAKSMREMGIPERFIVGAAIEPLVKAVRAA